MPLRSFRSLFCLALLGSAGLQPASAAPDLASLFAQAWQRQPEAQAAALRQQAAQAERASADSWSPEPAALSLEGKTDRWQRNAGSRELSLGVSLPLWLPGERSRKAALGDAEVDAAQQRLRAAQWRLAASVRQAWWDGQRARSALVLAQDNLASARQLAADVQRRFDAGDLARSELLQAQAALAQAEAVEAQAQGGCRAAAATLAQWDGAALLPCAGDAVADEALGGEIAPASDGTAPLADDHPLLADAQAQASVAQRSAALLAVQRRANPTLNLATTRSRETADERYGRTVTIGITVPLGAGVRAQARESAALAQALEAQTRSTQERQSLSAQVQAAQARAAAAAAQRDALARSAALAQQSRIFVARAFALGEADWPTRLRVEQEAQQAQRQAALARIDAAAAQSELRQALGLLPE